MFQDDKQLQDEKNEEEMNSQTDLNKELDWEKINRRFTEHIPSIMVGDPNPYIKF